MKGNCLKWCGALLVIAFLNMSCAGTEIRQQYADETYTGTVSNFLVIAVVGSSIHQRAFENEFVSQLKSIGVDAVSSADVMEMPSDLVLTKEMIRNAIQEYHNDAVIITQLAGRESENVYRSGSDRMGYYDYYRAGYRYIHGSGSKSSENTTVLLETMLFDAKTEKLIWSGISETFGRDPLEGELMVDVVKAMVDKLKNSRLIAR